MLRLLLVLCLLLTYSFASSQSVAQVDSLLTLLDNVGPKSPAKVDILNQLSSEYYDHDVNKGHEYATQALELASQIEYRQGMRCALSLKGFYYFDIGELDTALKVYRQGANINLGKEPYLAYNYVLTGNTHRALANYDSAYYFYMQAIGILNELKSQRFLAYAYRNLGRLYILQWKNELAHDALQQALSMYQQSKSNTGQAQTYFALADLSKNRSDYKAAQEFVSLGCGVSEAVKDDYLKLYCLVNRGEIFIKTGKYMESLNVLLQAVELLTKRDVPQTLVRVYANLGDVYELLGQYDVAMRYYFEALKIAERVKLNYEIGSLQSSIAWVYKNQHNFQLAFDFVEKAIAIQERIQSDFGIGNAYNVKGVTFFEQSKFTEALTWLNKALEVRLRIGNISGVSGTTYNIALVYEEQKQFRKALQQQMKSMKLEETIGNLYNMAVSYNTVGSIYTYMEQFDSASYYLKKAEKLGNETRSLYLRMDNSFFWSEFYEGKGEFGKALVWHKKYAELNDSVYNENVVSKVAEMQALYKTEQKEEEITLLNQEKQLQANEIQLHKARINQQNIIIISIVICLLLVSVLAVKTYQYNRRINKAHREITTQKEELQSQSVELKEAYNIIEYINKKLEAKVEDKTSELQKAYKELDTFFYRASHDFRRPLTTFLGLAEVANISVKDPHALELFGKVRDTARNLDKMLLKLQSISDMGSQQLRFSEVYFASIFNELVEANQHECDIRRINVGTSVVVPFPFYSFPALVTIIIENLFENAIYFSPYHNGIIKLRAFVEDNTVVVEVEDNGEGIPEAYKDKVFEMYFRGSERSKGNGLGLYIVKKAIEKLEGHISFTSKPGHGTTFNVRFPKET